MWKGPLFLIISVVGAGGFILYTRFVQTRRCDMSAVGTSNYIVATGVMLAACFATSVKPWGSSPYVLLGVLTGISFFVTWVFLEAALRRVGVSISSITAHLGIILPILVSIFIFIERPGPMRIAGIVLGVVCLPLVGTRANGKGLQEPQRPPAPGRGGLRDGHAALLLVGLFLGAGSNGTLIKCFKELGPVEDVFPYMFTIYAVAGIGLAVTFARRRIPVTRRDVLYGIPLGLFNCVSLFGTMFALRELDGSLVFPVRSAGSVLMTVGLAFLLFQERLRKRALVAIALGAVALVLMNLNR